MRTTRHIRQPSVRRLESDDKGVFMPRQRGNAGVHLHGRGSTQQQHREPLLRLVFAYKNFAQAAGHRHISHIGLGVAALNTAKVLRALGIEVDVWAIIGSRDLRNRLATTSGAPITHVVISAPWLPTLEVQALTVDYPNIQWAMNVHSNVGFLQADASGVQRFREALHLEQATHNFHVSGNSPRFVAWAQEAFQLPCLWLPNLYYLDSHVPSDREPWQRGTLRIGSFSAVRPLKNMMTAAAAALHIGVTMRADVEFWLNSGRTEGGGNTVEGAIKALYAGLPHAKVIEQPWQPWPQFRETVKHMACLLQPSYTESFSMVAADAISVGVPVVVSPAIYWAPARWRAEPDDTLEVAQVGASLVRNPHAAHDGVQALLAHDAAGEQAWVAYLTGTRVFGME